MAERMIKKEVIPFSVDGKAAWRSVLRHLAQKEDTPMDIACESRLVSSKRIFYPVERLTVNYEAHWKAVSIFIEEQTETYTVQEVHYFDRWGREHNSPGFDYYEDGKWHNGSFHPIHSRTKGYSGSRDARPWDPREVTVEKERKWEEEIGRKNSSGTEKHSVLNVLDQRYPFFSTLYGSYTGGERIAFSDEAVQGAVVEEVILANDEKKKQLIAKVAGNAQEICIKKIPGQKYANFHMDFANDTDGEVWYYPAYKIVYMYQGKQYECLVSGCTVDRVYETTHPTDSVYDDLVNQTEKRASELVEQRKNATKTIAISIAVGLFVELIAALMVLHSLVSLFVNGISGFLGFVFWGAVAVGMGYFVYKKYMERKNIVSEHENIHKEKENTIQNRQDRKRKILDIMTDDNLSDDEKKRRCKEI